MCGQAVGKSVATYSCGKRAVNTSNSIDGFRSLLPVKLAAWIYFDTPGYSVARSPCHFVMNLWPDFARVCSMMMFVDKHHLQFTSVIFYCTYTKIFFLWTYTEYISCVANVFTISNKAFDLLIDDETA